MLIITTHSCDVAVLHAQCKFCVQSAAFFISKRALATGVTTTVMMTVKIVQHQMRSRAVDTPVSSAHLLIGIKTTVNTLCHLQHTRQ